MDISDGGIDMENNWEWEGKQKEFIEKLERMDGVFNLIFEKDGSNQVIGVDEQMELRKMQRENKAILEKLQGREFSVAIVGLEKAGKSTLANSIIKQNALPEYTERCTYTTTEIRAGQNAEAEIFFFSRDEFNRKFREMLKSLKYDKTIADFTELSIGGFNSWWESMGNSAEGTEQKLTYQHYNATIAADVKRILENKDQVQKFLDKASEIYPTSDKEFKVYITGFASQDEDGRMTNRTAIPYAVKKVVIHSTTLEDNLKNIVLYDVPGFDSPTDLHKKQTEEMLKMADAIILVTNVGSNPDLTGTQLDMLRKVRDEDGIPLSSKAFVFGNRLDCARSKEVAIDNEKALKHDVEAYQIAAVKRVICGSAKAYLEAKGIEDSDSRGKTCADKKLDEWGLPYGRDELYDMMVDYYKHDRFQVLQERAERKLQKANEFLYGILEKYTPDVLDAIDTGGKFYLESAKSMNAFVRQTWNIIRNRQKEIWERIPFSSKIQEGIEDIFPLVDEEDPLLLQTREETAIGGDGRTENVTEIDANFRKKLKIRMLNNLKDKVAELTGTEQMDIREEVVQSFLNCINCEPMYKEDMAKSVRKLFEELRGKKTVGDSQSGLEACNFNTLIDRFAGSPIEVLIGLPFGSHERKAEVLDKAKFEFMSLAVYYDSTLVDVHRPEQEKQDIVFTKILAHSDAGGNPVKRNEKGIQSFFQRNKDTIFQGLSLATDILPMGKWAKLLAKAGVYCVSNKNSSWMDNVEKAMKNGNIRSHWPNMNNNDRQELVKRLVEDNILKYIDERKNAEYGDNDEKINYLTAIEERLQELGEMDLPRIKSTEEMLAVLNLDIKILQEIMRRAVIAAIGLERAFTTIIGKNGDFIRAVASDSAHTQIDDWFAHNIRKVRNSEFASIEQETMRRETKKNIVSALKDVLNKMEE